MLRFQTRTVAAVAVLAIIAKASIALAARPSETLLPSTTKGFVSVGDVDQLEASWNKTLLGQLMNDPTMKPFADDMKDQIKRSWSKAQQRLGFALEDLDGVPGGEACLAVIQPNATTGAVVMVIDVTGHIPQANAFLAKVAANMKTERAQKVANPRIAELTIYNLPLAEGEKKPQQTANFLKDNLLVIGDNLAVVEGIYARLPGKATDTLETVPAFKATMARCQTGAQGLVPHIRWFVEPFGYLETMRILNPPKEKPKKTDPLRVFREQGFTAIQGLGGYVNFAVEQSTGHYEMLHRTSIHAPAVKDGPEKYELAARMLKFPNGGEWAPHSFVPREIATYTTVNWDIKPGFQNSKSLINGLAGEENVIDEILAGLRDDPLGAQVDVEKDLIGNLGSRITVLSDYQLPIGPKSERLIVAAAATDEKKVAATVAKALETDPTARKLEFEGHVIWEIVNEENTHKAPVVTVPGAKSAANAPPPEEKGPLPNSAVSVAYGHMFVASHVDFLKKVLHQGGQTSEGAETLAKSIDFNLVMNEMKKVGISETSLRMFSRTDEEYRVTYELLRMGQMPQSETILGQILNKMFGEGKEGVVRKQRLDAKNLPEYDVVRCYLGPAGMFMTSENDGWYLVGFTLNKEMPVPPAVETAQAP